MNTSTAAASSSRRAESSSKRHLEAKTHDELWNASGGTVNVLFLKSQGAASDGAGRRGASCFACLGRQDAWLPSHVLGQEGWNKKKKLMLVRSSSGVKIRARP